MKPIINRIYNIAEEYLTTSEEVDRLIYELEDLSDLLYKKEEGYEMFAWTNKALDNLSIYKS